MDTLVHKLQEKLKHHPDNPVLQRTLSRLAAASAKNPHDDDKYHGTDADIEALRREGLIDAPDVSILESLQPNTSSRSAPITNAERSARDEPRGDGQVSSDGFRYVQANLSDTTVPRLPLPSETPTVLPVELVDLLNQTYFLHILATEPEKALPPGKSLLSVLSRPSEASRGATSALQDRVHDLVHNAFWDEAYESLSNPVPSVELTRLKGLYQDLLTALSPLLPSNHPVLMTLSSPLSPTSAPLRSTVIHLQEILHSLKERCAPSRDAQIDELVQQLDTSATTDLARVVVDVFRAILKLADDMKEDLSEFVLGTMGEQQLHEVVAAKAASQERELVLQLWRPARLQELWFKWLEELVVTPGQEASSPHERFVRRLMQAAGTNQAVTCNLPVITVVRGPSGGEELPSSPPAQTQVQLNNELPPPLLFVTPTVLLLQNYLQALVIAASLRSLVRIPSRPTSIPDGTPNSSSEPVHGFMERIWMLLKAEIEGEPGTDGTKIVNLADEVIRVRRLYGSTASAAGDADEEAKLRAAVDRTLHMHDPVFQLLQRRLVRAITERLIAGHATADHQTAPARMRTGRTLDRRPGKPLMMLNLDGEGSSSKTASVKAAGNEPEASLVVKGFEDPVLDAAIKNVVGRFRGCVEWTEAVWGDLLETPILDGRQ